MVTDPRALKLHYPSTTDITRFHVSQPNITREPLSEHFILDRYISDVFSDLTFKVKSFRFFYSDHSYRYLTRARFILIGSNAGIIRGEITAPGDDI